MAITRVVLVKTAPEKIMQGQWYRRPWLGLSTLASFIRARGIDCDIVDMQFSSIGMDEAVALIKRSGADLVGVTAMTHEISRADDLAGRIKQELPGSITAVGGPHCTALPLRTMQEFPGFDFAVTGEGEYTLLELIDGLNNDRPFEDIKGLAFRRDGQIVINERRDWIEDLDSLGFPAWDLYPAVEEYPIYSSRGCPFSCKFCMRVLGRKVRYRSPENVVAEMEYVVDKFGAKRISFQDETFTVNRQRAEAIIDMVVARGLNRKVRWDICSRVTELDYYFCRRKRNRR